TITDSITNYKKGFNNIELLLKYKFSLFNRDLILLNFNNIATIRDGFSVTPKFSNEAFIRTFYEDITIAYALGKKYMIVANAGVEIAKGNNRVNISPENGKTIDQIGYGISGGIDYDFSKNAGIHLRHRYMTHKDANFILDKFKGHETTFELKIFF